jgi:predicted ATPase/DNA-binding winged helix-turn-helix (wHTH) protein
MPVRFGDFELDSGTRQLMRGNERRHLGPKAFDLLQMLLSLRPNVVARERIRNRLWPATFVTDSTIATVVNELRSALGEDPKSPRFLRTVYGVGYAFCGDATESTASVGPPGAAGEMDAAADRRTDTLPRVLSALLGREQEVAAIGNLWRRDDVSLVTLTGVGGTGKTRLAVAVAREAVAELADGAFFVDLTPISDPALVASAIAQLLGVKEAGPQSLADTLKEYLHDKQLMLVLDNFEQVAAAAPLVKDLLVSSPRLKVLATSREHLNLTMEQVFSVPSLSLPPAHAWAVARDLLQYGAIALFVERARAAKPTFALTDENAHAVAKICTSLDGLPLAVELAAAWVRVLLPEQILGRLDHRLGLLTGGARDAPLRQQTMRGAIAWSYDLLDPAERRLLCRVSVFAGGLALEAAEAVCSTAVDLGRDVLDGLVALVDKSLLVQKELEDGRPRFHLLELVREYAAERLEGSGELGATRERHAAFFLSMAETFEPELLGTRQVERLEQLEVEHDNLRAALRWAIEREQAETALRLAGALSWFWLVRGHFTEGRRWLAQALAQEGAHPSARAKALHGAGTLAWPQGDNQAAHGFFEAGLALARAGGDRRLLAGSCLGLGIVAMNRGGYVAARALFEQCLALGREEVDRRFVAIALGGLGEIARIEGDYAAARVLYEEGLAEAVRLEDKRSVTIAQNNLGAVACCQGDAARARSAYQDALALARELGDRRLLATTLDGFAGLAVRTGENTRAVRLYAAAGHLRESIGADAEKADRNFRDAYIAEAQAALGEEDFVAAKDQGARLTLAEAIALAQS